MKYLESKDHSMDTFFDTSQDLLKAYLDKKLYEISLRSKLKKVTSK